MEYPHRVRIFEVGPRDGLQNESANVSVADKVQLIESLVDAGIRDIECGSFVSPKWVPQMADSGRVLSTVHRVRGVIYSALVPNTQGLSAARAAGADEIAIFTAASETFSQRNINCSIAESLERLKSVAADCRAHDLPLRGYVSCVLGCPYEGGDIAPARVAEVARALYEMGCYEVSLGDTIGVGTPVKTQRMIETVATEIPLASIAVHFHDTWAQALANILASLQLGISTVDSSVAGLGGCPYAPGAAGNVATEDVVYMLNGMGIETGVDLGKVAQAGRAICRTLGRRPTSKVAVALEAGSTRT